MTRAKAIEISNTVGRLVLEIHKLDPTHHLHHTRKNTEDLIAFANKVRGDIALDLLGEILPTSEFQKLAGLNKES